MSLKGAFLQLLQPQLVLLMFSMLLVLVLVLANKLPSTKAIGELVNTANTKGGNIIVLLFMTILFFQFSMKLFYFLMGLLVSKSITPDNAIALAGISFATGAAFGGSSSALYTTMSGSAPTTTTPGSVTTTIKTEKTEPKEGATNA